MHRCPQFTIKIIPGNEILPEGRFQDVIDTDEFYDKW